MFISKRYILIYKEIYEIYMDCKDVLCPPHTWDDEGNIVYGGSNQILTYFDISSAEVLIGRL